MARILKFLLVSTVLSSMSSNVLFAADNMPKLGALPQTEAQKRWAALTSLTETNIQKDILQHDLDFVWFCLYDINDPEKHQNISNLIYEVDKEALFVNYKQAFIKLTRMRHLEGKNKRLFVNFDKNLEMNVELIKESNCSEYNTSCDVEVNIDLLTDDSVYSVRALGQGCGV